MNITPDRWMHYLSSVGVNFINPYEEGWCFAPGTKVMTIDGVRNIEDIRKGDLILTPTKNVLGNVYQKADRLFAGTDEMYKIIPSVGCEEQIVTADHIVRYRYRINGKSEAEVRYDKAKDLMLKFKQNPYYKERCYLERIEELPHGIKYEGLDPYILGLWLGDGTKCAPEFESMDPEVIQYLEEYALTHGLRCSYRYRKYSKSMTIRLSSANNKKAGQCNKNALIEDLRSLGVYENKYMPKEFLNYDIDTRLQLLAGLIDTDGSVYRGKGNHGGYMEFTQCEERKQLVDMFVLIARSLGFKVGVKKVKSKITKIHHNKTITIAQPFYKVRIFDGKYIIPTKIARKQFIWPTKRVFNSNYAHFDMEFAGRGQYYGFSLEGDKHEFVLGDMTIVHNCVPGREGGKPATFNQITSLDLTMSNVIAEYIQLMDKIEQLAGTISGITEQREGAISSSELVGNVERSVVQSSHITEPLFWSHNQCKRHALNMLLNTAQGAWRQTGKQKLSYIFDNGERAYIDIQDKFYYEDMDVFVSDTSKDMENIQKLQQLIQPAMQNGASLLEAAEVLTNDNFNIIKQKLKEMQERQEQVMQQQQQAEQEQAVQLQQMQNEQREQELMLEEAKMELERYKIDADNQTKIAVAEISAYRGTEDKDANNNQIPDPMEIAKDATQQRKIASDEYTKRYEARQKKEIEDKKIDLEKQRMKHEMELQKQKDDAALERERVKARAAIRNKVAGEK